MTRKNPWAYKIDYEQSIADTELEISKLLSPVSIEMSASPTHYYRTRWWLFSVPDFWEVWRKSTMLGLSMPELCMLAKWCDAPDMPLFWSLADAAPAHSYGLCDLVVDRIEDSHYDFGSDSERRTSLKRAKSNLARYRRRLREAA